MNLLDYNFDKCKLVSKNYNRDYEGLIYEMVEVYYVLDNDQIVKYEYITDTRGTVEFREVLYQGVDFLRLWNLIE